MLALTELLGLYTVSTMLLLRRQLPPQYRAFISDGVGGELEFDLFHRWFNSVFLAAASLTAALCYSQFRRTQAEALDRLPMYIQSPARNR